MNSPEYEDGDDSEEPEKDSGWWRRMRPDLISVGKKLAITTVAMSAAPLALPPVCIVSVLSLAVAIPFGVLVATVAGTEKLMSSLLPLPVHQEDEEEEEDEEVLVETPVMETTLDEGLLYEEEKVWEEINCIRTVVGYNAGLQESYRMELKALYMFIGVEPPSSLTNLDLMDISDELGFLKSLVGVV